MNYVLDALEVVLAWDLPEDATADAMSTQAGLLAGISPEELTVSDLD